MPKRKQYSEYKNRFNKENYKVLAVRLPIQLVDDFKAECIKRSVPQAQVIRQAVENFLEGKTMKKFEIKKATAQIKKSQKNLIQQGITWTLTPDIDDTAIESFNTLEAAIKKFKEKYAVSKVSGFETFFVEEYYITETNYDEDGNIIDPWENDPIVWSEMPELD